MSDTKKEVYSNVQKSIFSMKLKKIRDQWKEDTGRTYEEMYAEVFGYSKPSMERALSGKLSVGMMYELATCVNKSVEEMTCVDFKTIYEFILYRLEKKEYKVMMFSVILLFWSTLVSLITFEWWAIFMVYLSATLLIENMNTSIWGTKINYTKEYSILKKILHIFVILYMLLGSYIEISARL